MRAEQVQQGGGLRAVATPAQLLRQLLTTGHDDEATGEHQPGLLEWYPTIVEWTTVRSVGAGGPGGKHAPLPFNADAMDFLGGRYWANPDCTMGEAGLDGEQDPENYREGFEPTLLGLEASVRRGLGFEQALQLRAGALEPKPGVVAALRWLGAATELLYDALPLLAETVHEEALRLIVRARGMTWGAKLDATKSQCPHCYQVESVWSDEARAVCITPTCRTAAGLRHCWERQCATCAWKVADKPRPCSSVDGRHLGVEWTVVIEPDVRGRGQVTDEQLERWSRTG